MLAQSCLRSTQRAFAGARNGAINVTKVNISRLSDGGHTTSTTDINPDPELYGNAIELTECSSSTAFRFLQLGPEP
jgi:hypothetical protein